ncbi:MAG: ParB/RepB/Spo0J family partition protein [Actinobacteria bacterium]|nr:ParB/RepB/Spo0J family partition protein [Actinomycetota bacterium]MCB9390040.1 ParB/RepB/Spo0J family partition protein [Acidimicrobiia bacterium]
MTRRSGLGKGLGALIPNVPEQPEGALRELPIGEIRPNHYQPRQFFDDDAIAQLAASIKELGLLQPVLVRPSETGYELIAGERRWRASQLAGLTHIPALVREVDDNTSLEQAIVENIHREQLNPLEEAAAYQQLIDDFGLTHHSVAQRVGKSRATITNSLRLLQLPASVQRMVREDQLSNGHARALLGVSDPSLQEHLARRVLADGLSVRAAEELVRATISPDPPAPPRTPTEVGAVKPAGLIELENLLADQLATGVKVDLGPKRGRIMIEFSDVDDLERIYRMLSGNLKQAQ